AGTNESAPVHRLRRGACLRRLVHRFHCAGGRAQLPAMAGVRAYRPCWMRWSSPASPCWAERQDAVASGPDTLLQIFGGLSDGLLGALGVHVGVGVGLRASSRGIAEALVQAPGVGIVLANS